MSVPFSNTHLRVPRGFGTILEGLAREVLRDQPEDIPKYAADYFNALLKKREERGMDPAEWGEISFDDVPQTQQITEVDEEQPEEEGSIEVLQTKILEMQQKEESAELAVSATDQTISDAKDNNKPEMEGPEVNSEGEEMESEHEAFDAMKEKVDANDSNLNDSDDDEKEKGVINTTDITKDNQEDETDHNNEDDKEISEGEVCQTEDSGKETQSDDPDFNDDEATVGGDKEEICTEGYSEMEDQEINDGGVENNSSEVTQSRTSTAGKEEVSETCEESTQHLPEENKESRRTLVESQPEDTVEEKEVTSKEAEEVAEGMIDSEVEDRSDAMHEEENIGLAQSAGHQGEDRPLESKETAELAVNSSDKEECSRPQEEEDIMDIPLDDPEANRAAAKIQAGFRGHMTRKKMKPEDKAEGEEVSSTGDALNGSQGDSETGRSGAVGRDDTSVPEH